MTLMQVRIDDAGVWHFSGGSEILRRLVANPPRPATQRRCGQPRVAADGQTMTTLWERTDDGKTWQPWMDIRFSRI